MKRLLVLLTILIFSSDIISREIIFGGRVWEVKVHCCMGPGGNAWSDSEESVWIDENGELHLRIRNDGTENYCSEIRTKKPCKYGMYQFQIEYPLDNIPECTVLGMFLYYEGDNLYEMDIEITKDFGKDNGWHVIQDTVQPAKAFTKSFSFDMNGQQQSTHQIYWKSDTELTFASFAGYSSTPPYNAWNIWHVDGTAAQYIPNESVGIKAHVNLWLRSCIPEITEENQKDYEVIVSSIEVPGMLYSIRASADVNGSVTNEGEVLLHEGEDITYQFTPDTGYRVSQVLINGVHNFEAVSEASYTVSNLSSDMTIAAEFEEITTPIASAKRQTPADFYNVRIMTITGTVLFRGNLTDAQLDAYVTEQCTGAYMVEISSASANRNFIILK